MAAVIAAGVFCGLYSGGHVASSPVTRAKVNMRSGHVIEEGARAQGLLFSFSLLPAPTRTPSLPSQALCPVKLCARAQWLKC